MADEEPIKATSVANTTNEDYFDSEKPLAGKQHPTTMADDNTTKATVDSATDSLLLSGSTTTTTRLVIPRLMVRPKPDSAPGTPRSRSRSPSLGRNIALDSSSLSSLETSDAAMDDILTDRAGIDDCLSESQRSFTKLQLLPVVERMTEDTLEDIHAFSDIAMPPSSRVSVCSTKGENDTSVHGFLERLEECDEEGAEMEAQVVVSDPQQILLTHMENLKIGGGGGGGTSGGDVGGEEESMSQFSGAAVVHCCGGGVDTAATNNTNNL